MTKNISFFYMIVLSLLALACQQAINEDLSTVAPRARYSTEKLITTLQSEKDYQKETVIAVSGLVHEINTKNNRTTILLKSKLQRESYVICDMNPNQITTINMINVVCKKVNNTFS